MNVDLLVGKGFYVFNSDFYVNLQENSIANLEDQMKKNHLGCEASRSFGHL